MPKPVPEAQAKGGACGFVFHCGQGVGKGEDSMLECELPTCACAKGVSVSAFLLAFPEEQRLKLSTVKHRKWSQTLLQGEYFS